MNQQQLDNNLERSAADTLARMGIDVSTAINMFLRQVVNDQGLPFQPTLHPQFSANVAPISVDDDNTHETRNSIDQDLPPSGTPSETVDCPQFVLEDEIYERRELEKMSFRVPKELADEIRSASMLAMAHGEVRSLSEWVVNAILMRLEKERIKFNHSLPFEPREKGTIPTGRR